MVKRSHIRKKFLIQKGFQLRYMAIVCSTLIVVAMVSIISIYMGIWGSVLDEFSNEAVRYQLLTAARMTDYEFARRPFSERRFSTLALFKETDLLSKRQREIFSDILNRTNKRLVWKVGALLIVIGIGTIFVTHRIAGPMYRFDQCFKQILSGNLTVRAHLRKTDEARELMISFNAMVDSLESSVKRIKTINPKVDPEAVRNELETELSRFRTR